MTLVTQNPDMRKGTGYVDMVYQDFSGGLNDTATPIAMKDQQVQRADNVDFSADVKAFSTRKGAEKLNFDSFGFNVTDGWFWTVVSTAKKAIVMDSKLYELVSTPWGTDHDYQASTYDALAEADQTWGNITAGKVLWFDISGNGFGRTEHYYKSLCSIGRISTLTEDFFDTSRWQDVTTTWDAQLKYDIKDDHFHPFNYNDRLYFTAGGEFYVWGDYDYTVEVWPDGTSIKTGDIVRYYEQTVTANEWVSGAQYSKGDIVIDDSLAYKALADIASSTTEPKNDTADWALMWSAHGEDGHFYQALTDESVIDPSLENFLDTTKWTDVTDVPNSISNVVRPVKATNTGKKETYVMTLDSVEQDPSGTRFGVNLDNVWFYAGGTSGLASNTSVEGVVADITTKLNAATATDGTPLSNDWLVTSSGSSITITAKDVGTKMDTYLDYATNYLSIEGGTTVQGEPDTNDLAPIRKCTMFVMFEGAMKVFATGNPDDNGIYYSELGAPDEWNSSINKLYPTNSHEAVTGMTQMLDYLLVSYYDRWFALSGDPADSATTWKRLNIPYGCVSNDSIAMTPYSFMFLAKEGIMCVEQTVLEQVYNVVLGKSIIANLTENLLDKTLATIKDPTQCKGVFYKDTYYLAYNIEANEMFYQDPFAEEYFGDRTDSYAGNTKVIRYEWDTKTFSVVSGWRVNQWMKGVDGLHFGSVNFAMKVGSDSYRDVQTEAVAHTNEALTFDETIDGIVCRLPVRAKNVTQMRKLRPHYSPAYTILTEGDDYTVLDDVNIQLNFTKYYIPWSSSHLYSSAAVTVSYGGKFYVPNPSKLPFGGKEPGIDMDFWMQTDGSGLKDATGISATYMPYDGEQMPINVFVRTKAFSLNSPAMYKRVKFTDFIFKQDKGRREIDAMAIVESDYKRRTIKDLKIPESLQYTRDWGLTWGWRAQQTKAMETALVGSVFSATFMQKCTGMPMVLVCLSFNYQSVKNVLPKDEPYNKDSELYQEMNQKVIAR